MTEREPLVTGFVLNGRYLVEKVLGEGTFWLTYLARDRQGHELVVIKEYLPTGLARRAEGHNVEPRTQTLAGIFVAGRSRVLQEAARVAGISHPSVAAAIVAFEENGTAYVVREYVEGQSIVNWGNALSRPPTQGELDHVFGKALDALQAVHAQGVWHLDLTPDHVLIRASDKLPVLTDFGEARAAVACNTRAIHTFVRPGYSPPDQHVFEEAAQGPWTDVYGIAAVFYRVVTGRGPLDVVSRNHTDEMPKAAAVTSGLYRPAFLHAIDEAMALDPSARQQTVDELKRDLLGSNAPPSLAGNRRPHGGTPRPFRPKGFVELKRSVVSRLLALILALVIVGGAIGSFVVSRSAQQASNWRDPRVAEAIDRAKIFRNSNPQALLQTAVADPSQRDLVERRLRDLGLIRIALAETTIWRKPGSGEPFRDCPTCPELVTVPSGAFLMGSSPTEEGRGDDEDDTAGPGGERVAVKIVRPFAVGRFAVTRAEFEEFVQQAEYKMGPGCHARYGRWQLFPDLSWQHPGFEQEDRHPVVCVNWNDAQAYVAWLSRITGQSYRLPTEQEREYATRASAGGGAQPRYFFGDKETDLCRYANIADLEAKSVNPGWTVVNCRDGFAHTAPVGSFEPNAFGLYDMTGNVWEWTADCFKPNLARAGELQHLCSLGEQRALRGGSWRDGGALVRSASRIASSPEIRDEIVGFRVVRDLPQ